MNLISQIAENNRKKSIVHSEMMVSLAKNTGEKERKVAAEERKCKDRMSVVLVSSLSTTLFDSKTPNLSDR